MIVPFSARPDRPSPARTRAARRPVSAPIRIAGAGLLIASVVAYWALGGSWWLAPILLLAPDLSAIGFLVSIRFGVPTYNSAHRLWAPLALLALALLTGSRIGLLVAVAWLGHIGMDRAAGYGLRDVGSPAARPGAPASAGGGGYGGVHYASRKGQDRRSPHREGDAKA